MEKSTKIRVIICAGLIILSIVLGFILSPRAMDNNTSSADYLTGKRTEVMELAAAAAANGTIAALRTGSAARRTGTHALLARGAREVTACAFARVW